MAPAYDPAADRRDPLRTVAWLVLALVVGCLIGFGGLFLSERPPEARAIIGRAR